MQILPLALVGLNLGFGSNALYQELFTWIKLLKCWQFVGVRSYETKSLFLLSCADFQCHVHVPFHNHVNYIWHAVVFQLPLFFFFLDSHLVFLSSPDRNHAIKWILFSKHWNNSHRPQYTQWKREAPGRRLSRTLVSVVCPWVVLSSLR